MYKNYMRGGGKGPIILDYEIINQNLLKYVYLNITNCKITKKCCYRTDYLYQTFFGYPLALQPECVNFVDYSTLQNSD